MRRFLYRSSPEPLAAIVKHHPVNFEQTNARNKRKTQGLTERQAED